MVRVPDFVSAIESLGYFECDFRARHNARRKHISGNRGNGWYIVNYKWFAAIAWASTPANWANSQYVIDSKWWPETGSNRRRRPFQGPLPMVLSGLELADPIETKAVSAVPI
jgi:hypothetical protein